LPTQAAPARRGGTHPQSGAAATALWAFLERDLEQADACVSVDRAQAGAGRSREGATGFGPARQLRSRRRRSLASGAADFSRSAVYRLVELQRARNARIAYVAPRPKMIRSAASFVLSIERTYDT
jgi:hypothetical protein